ncbi:MAG: hypothetical protein P8L91_04845 [Candidatus Marinimicrobia bacterium]|jgi:hypothetical protein|nr:hypothetical protein [Candidatus Neomarinimicrobiota bacterium]
MQNWTKILGIIGVLGLVQFLLFSTVAMYFYSGGTSWNKLAEGYTFWHNVMSDLGRTVSYSGLSNTISSRIFNSSLMIFGISIIIIYLNMSKSFLLSRNIVFFTKIIGIISGLGMIGVALTPDDILSDEHMLAVWIWILSLTTVLILFIVSKVTHQVYDSIFYVSAILLFAVLIHIGQGLLDMWSPIVATTQKIVVYLNVLWYLLISKNIINQNQRLIKI